MAKFKIVKIHPISSIMLSLLNWNDISVWHKKEMNSTSL
jgi:hypothetical protein